jgi:hypothetical protein
VQVFFAMMGEWTLKPVGTLLLLVLLVTIGLIQVLPQVDLPDTAFHEDTAPVVTKFRATSAPVMPVIAVSAGFGLFNLMPEYLLESLRDHPITSVANSFPILYCSLLC